MTLVALPPAPAGVSFPTQEWAHADGPPAVEVLLAEMFAEPQPETMTRTDAVLLVHRGRIVAERYRDGITPANTLPSWSMAKSILHAAVGVLVRDGKLDVAAPATVPEWRDDADPRGAITLNDLLQMAPGLRWAEDYVRDDVSDVIKMLFRPGTDDTGAFAASYPLVAPPGTVSNYSSGTSNIVARIVRDIVGRDDAYAAFLRREIFEPIGMTTATPKFDRSGTWIGSSYCFATARDFARLGLLYMRDGVWDGRRILPQGWVDYARTPAPAQPTDTPRGYGAHWWLLDKDPYGTFFASGYLGQYIFVVPALDLIVVRSGETATVRRPFVVEHLRRVFDAFA